MCQEGHGLTKYNICHNKELSNNNIKSFFLQSIQVWITPSYCLTTYWWTIKYCSIQVSKFVDWNRYCIWVGLNHIFMSFGSLSQFICGVVVVSLYNTVLYHREQNSYSLHWYLLHKLPTNCKFNHNIMLYFQVFTFV